MITAAVQTRLSYHQSGDEHYNERGRLHEGHKLPHASGKYASAEGREDRLLRSGE
jgi:hypothetical protein